MMKLNSEEWFPIVNEEGGIISKASRSVCHDGKSRLLHPVVHLHLFNDEGKLFLQKRAMIKDLFPGKWDTSVGGHISPEESVEEALKREVQEELGLKDFKYQFIQKYIWESPLERELVYSFTGNIEEIPVLNFHEIEAGKYWPLQEIRENIGKEIFTPNFEFEFNMLNIITSNTIINSK